MLTRMDKTKIAVVSAAQLPDKRRDFHKIGPGAADKDDFQEFPFGFALPAVGSLTFLTND